MVLCEVQRASDAVGAEANDVRIDHCRGHVAVTEELLDRADVVAALEEVGGE